MFHAAALVIGAAASYLFIGSGTVLATAYVNRRVSGKQWFGPDIVNAYDRTKNKPRWLSCQEADIVSPATIFWLWPVMIPANLAWVVISGFLTVTEKMGDKLIAKADEQRKRIGAFRDNPQ